MPGLTNVSPFAADSARKSGSKPELSAASVVMGSRHRRSWLSRLPKYVLRQRPRPERSARETAAVEIAQAPQSSATGLAMSRSVLAALADSGQRMLSAMLESGEWQVEGNELVVKVSSSATVIEMSLGADAKRLIVATASGVMGTASQAEGCSGGVVQVRDAEFWINQWRRQGACRAGSGCTPHERKIRR